MIRSVTYSCMFFILSTVVIFRILLALTQLFILLEDPVSALPYALNCLTISCSHFMDNSAALASLYIAQIQVYGKTISINMQLFLIQQFPRPRVC